jgi:hypothetical protein
MSDTTLWLDAFPRDWDAAHERRVPGRAAELRHGRTVTEPASW